MKKKKIYYIIAVLITANLFSCNKILELEPLGKLTFEKFWSSKEQAVAAVAGLYSKLGQSYGMKASSVSPLECYLYWGELRGELVYNNPGRLASNVLDRENVSNLTITPSDVITKYTEFYYVINGCNQAIKYIPTILEKDPSFTTEDEKNLLGEAYFCRAFAYFWLVRAFKEVPLVLTPTLDDTQDYNIPKSTMEEVFAQIASDLEIAKESLPRWYGMREDYSRCRATRYTALTVLSDVYLWMAATTNDAAKKTQYYDNVIKYCTEVIDSKRFYLMPGSRWGEIFTLGTSGETIFESYASQPNNQTNNLYGWTISNSVFTVPAATDDLFAYTEIRDYRSATPPDGTTGPVRGSQISINASSRNINKYNRSTNDPRWIHYRYPEVLLMKAEALAHRNPDNAANLTQAAELIHEIRLRAYGVSYHPRVEVLSTYEMDNVIIDERGREFIGEGKRWFELVRFASRDNFAEPGLLINRLMGKLSAVEQLTMRPRILNPESWYLPLNSSALASNPKLVQNPYYK